MTKITFGIFFATLIVFEISLKKVEAEEMALKRQLTVLKQRIEEAKSHQHYLKKSINSQSDPAWIEMVLKKELGLVPEGQTKIYFPD